MGKRVWIKQQKTSKDPCTRQKKRPPSKTKTSSQTNNIEKQELVICMHIKLNPKSKINK